MSRASKTCTFFFAAAFGAQVLAQSSAVRPYARSQAAPPAAASPSAARSPAAAQSALVAAAPSPPLEYRLTSGDLIKITVYQNADLSIEARITENGFISYPLLGMVRLGGTTTTQAEQLIADGLRQRDVIKQPQVSILVTQVRGNQASVLGQVGKAGRYPIETADMRLTDLIATAGGIATTGADLVVLVGERQGRPYRVEIDLPTLFQAGRRGDDILIRNGDIAYVERSPQIYIYGEVQKPGAYRLERGMTVMQALATGGGLTQRGTERRMRVHRTGPDGKVQIIQPALDDPLREGDVVYVRESLI